MFLALSDRDHYNITTMTATARKPDPIDQPHFFKIGRQFHFRRHVPKWLRPIVLTATWWQRLGSDEAPARRAAAALSRRYDRLCTPAMRRLVESEGGADQVREHLAIMALSGPAEEPPEELLKDLHAGVPGGFAFAVNLHNMLAEAAKADRERNARLAPLVDALETDPGPISMTVSAEAAEWLADIKPASEARYVMVLKRFRELMGDPSISAVDRAMAWNFRDQIAGMPALPGLKKEVRRLPAPRQIAWRRANPGHPAILPGAVTNHLAVLRSLFTWSLKRGHVTSNPFSHVDAPADPRGRDPHHHPAMHYSDLPGFMTELARQDRPAAVSLRFAILTAARRSEAIGARWSEIDLVRRVWTIPAPRMKERREHTVPLSTAAVELLSALPRTDARVFPKLSRVALRDLLVRIMGKRDVTVHGFRTAFRTWAAEETKHDRDAAELSLSHTVAGRVEAAYQRGTMLAKRRALMEDWATFCCLTQVRQSDATSERKTFRVSNESAS
jgi:integrase